MQSDVIADSYAIIELLKGNATYEQLLTQNWMTTEHALIEVYYHLLRTYGEETAQQEYTHWKRRVQPTTDTVIWSAMRFRYEHRKDDLSYADCIGYSLAEELGIPFLTGDEKFKEKKNVLFVK